MLLGFDDSMKSIKRALAVTGGDEDAFKMWNKTYDRVHKQFENSYTNYHLAKDSMEEVLTMLEELEKLLSDTRDWQKESLRMVAKTMKELHKHEGKQYHVLLVGRDHTDYCTTYESIMRLGESFDGDGTKRIMLQSEVENLLAIIRETRERANPNMNHLAYFETMDKLSLLEDISYEEKLRTMENVYKREFYKPIFRIISENIDKADKMVKDGMTGLGANRKLDALRYFTDHGNVSSEERAKILLKEIA